MVRYADDFVLGFQYRSDGLAFHAALNERLAEFGLCLHPDKTRLLEFGRFAASNRKARGQGKPESFEFLGFTHVCAVRRSDGRFTVRRLTIAARQRAILARIRQWLMTIRCIPVCDQGRRIRQLLTGLIQYYGVPGNRRSLDAFRTEICRQWCRALRRRGNKRPINWSATTRLIRQWVPSVRIVHPYPNQRFGV